MADSPQRYRPRFGRRHGFVTQTRPGELVILEAFRADIERGRQQIRPPSSSNPALLVSFGLLLLHAARVPFNQRDATSTQTCDASSRPHSLILPLCEPGRIRSIFDTGANLLTRQLPFSCDLHPTLNEIKSHRRRRATFSALLDACRRPAELWATSLGPFSISSLASSISTPSKRALFPQSFLPPHFIRTSWTPTL